MKWTYACPRCAAVLNPREDITLVASHADIRALINFHPRPGDYAIYLPEGVAPRPGELWDFACPVCAGDLTAEGSEGFGALTLCRAGEEKRLLFSRVAGETATFVFDAEGLLEEHHGEGARDHLAFMTSFKYLI